MTRPKIPMLSVVRPSFRRPSLGASAFNPDESPRIQDPQMASRSSAALSQVSQFSLRAPRL